MALNLAELSEAAQQALDPLAQEFKTRNGHEVLLLHVSRPIGDIPLAVRQEVEGVLTAQGIAWRWEEVESQPT